MQIVVPNMSEKATTLKERQEENKEPIMAVEANFEQDDGIGDIDLLKAICGIEEEENVVAKPNTCSTTVVNTNTVYNQIPKSFFANCQIGTISVNFHNK